MKFIRHLIISVFAILPLTVFAAPPPPYLSIAEAEGVSFEGGSCTAAASHILRADGFSRVITKGNIVFGAYRPGRDYGFKVSMKCLNHHNLVSITVVSASSGGLAKARSLAAQLRNYTEESDIEEELTDEEYSDDDDTASVNCSTGSNLVRCLDSIPSDSIKIAQQYLGKRL